MGLDQFAYAQKDNEEEQRDICSWRKHNRLQGWMEQLWIDKGSPGNHTQDNPLGDFNCVPLELSLEDIQNLEDAIYSFELPETAGFFFGDDSYFWKDEDGQPYSEDDYFYKDQDVEFIESAKEALAEGYKVYYNSWY